MDQVPMSSRFSRRGDAGVTRNYGRLLEDLVASVPKALGLGGRGTIS